MTVNTTEVTFKLGSTRWRSSCSKCRLLSRSLIAVRLLLLEDLSENRQLEVITHQKLRSEGAILIKWHALHYGHDSELIPKLLKIKVCRIQILDLPV